MEATFTNADSWGTKSRGRIQYPSLKVKMLPFGMLCTVGMEWHIGKTGKQELDSISEGGRPKR